MESFQFTKSRICKVFNLLLTGHLFVHSLLCIISGVYILNLPGKLELAHCFMLFLCGGCFGVAVFYNLYWFVIGDVALHCLNSHTQLNKSLYQEGTPRYLFYTIKNSKIKRFLTIIFIFALGFIKFSEHTWDPYGFCNFFLVLASGVFPFFYTAGAIYMDYDALSVIINYLAPELHERSLETIAYLLLFRATSVFIAVMEPCRSGCFFGIMCFSTVSQFTKLVNSILKLAPLGFLKTYQCFNLCHCRIIWEVNKIIYFLFSMSFWLTVCSACVLLKCWEKIDHVMYACAWLVLLGLSVEQILIFPGAVAATVKTKKIVMVQRQRMKLVFCARKTRRNRYIFRSTSAVKPATFWYSNFVMVDWDFLLEYFELLLERIFDGAVLMDMNL